MKELTILCEGTSYIDYKGLQEFQEDIKSITRINLDKLKESIKKGFKAPLFIWLHNAKYYILDGHQRKKALEELEEEGWIIPNIPVIQILEKTKKKAKEAVLVFITQYGDVKQGTIQLYMNKYKIKPINLVIKNNEINLDNTIFDPALNPKQHNREVNGKDIERAQNKIYKNYYDNKEKIELICPECGEKFYLDKKDYDHGE